MDTAWYYPAITATGLIVTANPQSVSRNVVDATSVTFTATDTYGIQSATVTSTVIVRPAISNNSHVFSQAENAELSAYARSIAASTYVTGGQWIKISGDGLTLSPTENGTIVFDEPRNYEDPNAQNSRNGTFRYRVNNIDSEPVYVMFTLTDADDRPNFGTMTKYTRSTTFNTWDAIGIDNYELVDFSNSPSGATDEDNDHITYEVFAANGTTSDDRFTMIDNARLVYKGDTDNTPIEDPVTLRLVATSNDKQATLTVEIPTDYDDTSPVIDDMNDAIVTQHAADTLSIPHVNYGTKSGEGTLSRGAGSTDTRIYRDSSDFDADVGKRRVRRDTDRDQQSRDVDQPDVDHYGQPRLRPRYILVHAR